MKITLTVAGEKYALEAPGGEAIEDEGEKILGNHEPTEDTYKVCLAPPAKDRST